MDTGCYDVPSLRRKYSGFVSPAVTVLVDGAELGGEYAVTEAEVETTAESGAVGMAVLKIANTADTGKKVADCSLLPAFPLAKSLEVKMGYGDHLKTVFKGYIFERVLSAAGGDLPSLTVYGLDSKSLLRLNTACESYKDMKSLSALVEEILKKYPMPTEITATPNFAKPMTLSQDGISDYALLCRAAEETGYELLDDLGTLVFRKFAAVSGDILRLDAQDVRRLEQKTSLAGMVSKLELYGYNADTKTTETACADAPPQKIGSGRTGAEWLGRLPATLSARLHMTAKSSKPLGDTAKTLLHANSLTLAELTAVTAGLPEIIPGRFLRLDKLGGDWDNRYYIRSVRHRQRANSFVTEIRCLSNTVER